eukprot:UN2993
MHLMDSAAEAHREGSNEWFAGVRHTVSSILKSSVYTLLVLGYCATIFTVCGISSLGAVLRPRSHRRRPPGS